MTRGLIHVYTGDGKGKTTASVGLSVRAAGAGLPVVFSQFMKAATSSEVKMLEKLDGIQTMVAQGKAKFSFKMTEEEKEQTKQASNDLLKRAFEAAGEGPCLLVLDESLNAYRLGLIDKEALERAVITKPEQVELVLTGRKADLFFIEHADYVTEMVAHKHPYATEGIKARKGIEF